MAPTVRRRPFRWSFAAACAALALLLADTLLGPRDTLAQVLAATEAAPAIRVVGETGRGRVELLWVRGVGRRVEQWQGSFRIPRVDDACNLEIPEKRQVTQCESGADLDYPQALQDLLAELRRRAAARGETTVEEWVRQEGRALLRLRFPMSKDEKAFYLDPATRRILRIEWREPPGQMLVTYRFGYPRPETIDRRVFAAGAKHDRRDAEPVAGRAR
jgi:hypothetical protein